MRQFFEPRQSLVDQVIAHMGPAIIFVVSAPIVRTRTREPDRFGSHFDFG
jgi:hypothetical protein